MRALKISAVLLSAAAVVFASGCVPQEKYNDLKAQNKIQQQRISEMEGELNAAKLALEQLNQQLAALRQKGGISAEALQKEVDALQKAIAEKNALIEKMQAQLLRGGMALPVELNAMLQDFADKSDMVTYDAESGVVKFKSDLLFEKGSDAVAAEAVKSIKALCDILNTEEGKSFDIIVAGHTDDLPIAKPETRAKHPNNWYLSAHRAISVLEVMTSNGIAPKRISERGMGEYRPFAENAPGKKGNPLNRRVEIFIVPAGM